MDCLFVRPVRLFIPLFLMAAMFGLQNDMQAGKPDVTPAGSAVREISAHEYVASYAPIAIKHKEVYGIPASVKMAQAMLESGNGNSDLARRSNNHFGIKCKSEWTGESVYHDDDEAGECFRKYATIIDSYTDHSEFLRSRSWYASLFELNPADYKAWAHGLKAAGYATDREYAEKLIGLIEKYELYLLDSGEYPSYISGVVVDTEPVSDVVKLIDTDDLTVSVFEIGGRNVFLHDGVRYIIAREGDSYESLAHDLGIPTRRLLRFNGKQRGASPMVGDAVYIEKVPKK